jgi:hypothetical protein
VKADLDDVESLKKAFAGAYGVYAVTNFWEHFSGEKEKTQAKNVADAAKAAGAKHVIWSTLEDIRKFMKADDKRMPMLQQKYRVPHFDAKAEADAYFKGLPVTYLVTSFYWDNSTCSAWRRRRARTVSSPGRSRWAPPKWRASRRRTSARPPGIFKAGSQYISKTVGILGGALTIEQMGKTYRSAGAARDVTRSKPTPTRVRPRARTGLATCSGVSRLPRMLANRSLETPEAQSIAAVVRAVRHEAESHDLPTMG